MLLGSELALRAAYLGRRAFLRVDWHKAKIALLVLSVVDVLAAMVYVNVAGSAAQAAAPPFNASHFLPDEGAVPIETPRVILFRLSPLLRPALYVASNVRLRALVGNLARTLSSIAELVALIVLVIFFYATLGVLVFRDFGSSTTEADRYFSSFTQALESMMVLMTTANYPGARRRGMDARCVCLGREARRNACSLGSHGPPPPPHPCLQTS